MIIADVSPTPTLDRHLWAPARRQYAIGMQCGGELSAGRFPLKTRDMVVLYADGVTAARNAAGAFFGVDRLMQIINAQNHLEPEPLIDAIHSLYNLRSSEDDRSSKLQSINGRLTPRPGAAAFHLC